MVCVYQLRTRSCLVAYLLYVLQERVPSRRSVVILVCVSTCSFARQHRREYNATSGASRRTEHALRHVNTASSIESKVNNRADANSPQHDLQLLHTHRERFLCCKAPARAPCAFASQPVHHHALLIPEVAASPGSTNARNSLLTSSGVTRSPGDRAQIPPSPPADMIAPSAHFPEPIK
jgi:hypothetical protein